MELPNWIRYCRWWATLLLAIGWVLVFASSRYYFLTFLAALIVHVVLIVFVATVLMTKVQSGLMDDQARLSTLFRSCEKNLIFMMRTFHVWRREREKWPFIILGFTTNLRLGVFNLLFDWISEALFLLPSINYLQISPSLAANLKKEHSED